ncbi:MAG: NTP transferase domain-containing protein, partial [Deltaproteobacteria bacterium]|nr:NTP transferase domain-containing protein [Deltaproteobacteria bacterium]
MKCLIIAAGRGSRLQQKYCSKPLVPLLGVPIIERVIRNAVSAGIDDFYVVTGYKGEEVRSYLDELRKRCSVRITHIVNDDWEKGNGISVLKAQEKLKENFLLMMGDHLVEPMIIRKMVDQKLLNGEIVLAVERNTNNPMVNLNDVTKVWINNGKLGDIGKDLTRFNGFDTGVFLCSPAIFEAINESISGRGDSSLSGGVKWLTEKGKVKIWNTGGRFWIDIDDPEALKKAEDALLQRLRGKNRDGPVSRYLNRPISIRLSRHLAGLPLTPNHISLISFLLSMMGAGLFLMGGYLSLLAGGIVAQVASIVDGCDGEIARLKYQESTYGGWLDAVLDRYADAFLLFGLTFHAFLNQQGLTSMFVGFLAIIGSFMVSYTADKYDRIMEKRIGKSGFRIGRDVRIFLIFLGATLNAAFWALCLLAAL